jgi:hypothetical protein
MDPTVNKFLNNKQEIKQPIIKYSTNCLFKYQLPINLL